MVQQIEPPRYLSTAECSDSNPPAAPVDPGAASKKGGEMVLVDFFGGGKNKSNENKSSLQERFKQFRKSRKRERVLAERAHLNAASTTGPHHQSSLGGRTKEHKDILRKKFVDACMSYIGVPYAQRKHTPDEEDYQSPLFLDCCGLVRRALQDLEAEFGFRVGKWNQAYQYETLGGGGGEKASERSEKPWREGPELSFAEMKPGDLVFVEGTYFNKAKKPQRHRMVHVEVFIGGETGLATVGSRWARTIPEENKVGVCPRRLALGEDAIPEENKVGWGVPVGSRWATTRFRKRMR